MPKYKEGDKVKVSSWQFGGANVEFLQPFEATVVSGVHVSHLNLWLYNLEGIGQLKSGHFHETWGNFPEFALEPISA